MKQKTKIKYFDESLEIESVLSGTIDQSFFDFAASIIVQSYKNRGF